MSSLLDRTPPILPQLLQTRLRDVLTTINAQNPVAAKLSHKSTEVARYKEHSNARRDAKRSLRDKCLNPLRLQALSDEQDNQ